MASHAAVQPGLKIGAHVAPPDLLGFGWSVDRNSDRTAVRLESHRFQWARSTGGVAGGHPSNILDNPHPVGAVNLNGDLPVLLVPDGPNRWRGLWSPLR
ncbi:MAG: hypothetical protein ABSG43_06800 [Solirubrobacteraceae bacterium]|jgi:allophanate hydrolase subunit 2